MFRSVRRWIAYVLIIGAVVGVTGMIALAATAPRRDFNDDFTITSFDAVYELERSGDRLDVLVTETIATDFAGSMNHGIIRAIPRKYQSHVNEITDVRVDGRLRTHTSYSYGEDEETPKQWHPVQVKEDYTGTVLSLKIGSASEYLLEGEQFYRISYRLTDVAMNTPNGKAQEVYLDVNGSGWDVPTDRVTAELIVPADLTDRLNGNAACYQGAEGSTAVCTISRSGTDPVTFTASATDLNAWQSMTFAVGFVPDTFPVAYTPDASTSPPSPGSSPPRPSACWFWPAWWFRRPGGGGGSPAQCSSRSSSRPRGSSRWSPRTSGEGPNGVRQPS